MSIGFIKYNRTETAKNLHSRPNENHLLGIIAYRISRNGNPVKGVKKGEALIGDYKKIGLTRREYRTAIENLIKWGYVTKRATNKGTYASLANIEVYDTNLPNERPTDRPTSDQPTGQRQATIKNERIKEEKKVKNERSKDIVQFLEIANYFKSVTGRDIRIGQTDAKIMGSDKYKLINARIVQGNTVEDCKLVIDFMFNKWKDNKEMQDYIRISTFFGFKNFEKYLDSAINKQPSNGKPKQFPYELPNFKDGQARFMYFFARYNAYKPQLDEGLINTEYRTRALINEDAEGLCFELELQFPQLLDIEFNYQS